MEKKELEQRNKGLKKISYVYIGLFIVLMINLIRFVIFDSLNISINSYNPRLGELEDNIIRGTIYDVNENVLAQTLVEEDLTYRIYPYGKVFSHIIGYSHHGKTGIEALVNLELLKSDGSVWNKIIRSITGERSKGNNVITTLDASLQTKAYELLGENKGAIVAIEPSTGKILCMVSKPDFNPNYVSEDWELLLKDVENSPLINRATQGLYPPGSIFKILTALNYMENEEWKNFIYFCTGVDIFGQNSIQCYGKTAHGREDLLTAFVLSCNTAFSTIGNTMDRVSFRELCHRFLFNKKLPYPLPYSKSSFKLTSESSLEEVAETSIGQGRTLITPLHSALIVSSIANAGILMKPYLIDRIENYEGEITTKNLPTIYSTLMDVEYSNYLTEFMIKVVSEGTGKTSAVEGIVVAGKTGSAENPFGNTHAWYVGFAPAKNPQIAISILVETAGSSSANAAPIAKKLFELYLN